MKKDLLVVFRNPGFRYRVLPVERADKASSEKLVIVEAARKWQFSGKKFRGFGTFEFGKGPTNEQKEKCRIYPKTQTVLDRASNENLEIAFSFLTSNAFGSGYDAGGAIDDGD